MPAVDVALETLLPHRGAMCLLASVEAYDAETITCRASGHRAADHPLRVGGRLPALAAIEYAAQAMAAHGGLGHAGGAAASAAPGQLVAVRHVSLHAATLDDVTDDLEVTATRLASDAAGLVYAFAVKAGHRVLAEGRATVMFPRSAA